MHGLSDQLATALAASLGKSIERVKFFDRYHSANDG